MHPGLYDGVYGEMTCDLSEEEKRKFLALKASGEGIAIPTHSFARGGLGYYLSTFCKGGIKSLPKVLREAERTIPQRGLETGTSLTDNRIRYLVSQKRKKEQV